MRRIAYDSSLVGQIRLDLGCGDKEHQRPGHNVRMDGVDFGQEIVADILTTGIPLPDNSCEWIMSSHFFEHLPWGMTTIDIFNECWRVLKPDGTLYVIVPGVDKPNVRIPVHISHYSESSFRFFEGSVTPDASAEMTRRSYNDVRFWDIHELVTNQRGDIHCKMSPRLKPNT